MKNQGAACLTQELEPVLTKAKNIFFVGAFTAIAIGSALISPAAAESAPSARPAVRTVSSNALPDAVVKAEKLHRSANMSYQVAGKRYYPMRKVAEFSQTGKATWYGNKFHGRKTSSGERYDMNMMTAAHKTLPIPSYAKVTNLANGKSVVVRINDRGPFHSSRVMDLSKAAAGKLGFINQGTANVRVEQVLPGSGETLAANAGSGHNIYVNLKSFGSEAEAKSYLSQTSRHLNSAQSAQKVVMVKQNNQYVVRMGPFAQQDHADSAKRQVQTAI